LASAEARARCGHAKLRQLGRKRGLSRLERVEAREQRGARPALRHGIDQRLDLAVERRELGYDGRAAIALGGGEARALLAIGLDQSGDGIGREKTRLEAGKRPPLERLDADDAGIVAGAGLPLRQAVEPVLAHDREGAAARGHSGRAR
jgi:hypothetical protein